MKNAKINKFTTNNYEHRNRQIENNSLFSYPVKKKKVKVKVKRNGEDLEGGKKSKERKREKKADLIVFSN